MTQKLSKEAWLKCVDSMPIFGIDMIILINKSDILMGKRINNPAKGKLFVPGGRVYKNESREEAFKRILINETGLDCNINDSISMGLFEHFYNTNFLSDENSNTHYIIEARLIKFNVENKKREIKVNQQHSELEWININKSKSKQIHYYSKLYIDQLIKLIK